MTQLLTIPVSESIGTVSARLLVPDDLKFICMLAHGAGAGMTHAFMEGIAAALAGQGIGTLRFNFPYMEHKKKRPDVPAIAHATIAAALNKAHQLYPKVPLLAAGKSFGGRMSSQYVAKEKPACVKGLVFFGFPLHPAGKPSAERAEHLREVEVPKLFLQGTRDELADWSLINEVCASMPNAQLTAIDGANHAFFVRGRKDVLAMLAAETAKWIQTHVV